MAEEKQDTKKCKHCQTDIPKKASKCPNCQGDLRNWFRKHPILTGVIIVFLLIIFIPGGNNSNKTSDTSTAQKVDEVNVESVSNKEEIVENAEFSVGDVIKMRNWELTVNGVSKAKSKGYSTAKTGKEYVFVKTTIRNTGDEEAKGVGSFDFKIQDSNGVLDGTTYISLDDGMQGYVDLAPGGVLTGTMPFETPEDDNGLKLIFQPNFWIDNQRIVVNLQ